VYPRYRHGLLALVCLLLLCACNEGPAQHPAFAAAAVKTGPLRDSVAATGRVHTVASVNVSSQLSGRIDEVFVDFNDVVAAEQILARLDPQRFQSRVAELTASLAVAEADAESARAAVAGAEASYEEDVRDYQRKLDLSKNGSVSESELSRAEVVKRQSDSALRVRQADRSTKAAVIAAARASLRQAEIDLERSVIKAPISGVVISRQIEPGQTVAASLSAPDLFVIAHDLKDIEIHARVDEADIGKVAAGQAAKFSVDAHPGNLFSGEVSQIRKAPEISQGVVSYTVVIKAGNPDELMLPGMTAMVEIITSQRDAVLQVPNAALRFEMPVEYSTEYSQAEMEAFTARVWVLSGDGAIEPRQLEIGYSDSRFSEVVAGNLQAGENVIVGYKY
jgi:HlyD family secretion protein